MFSSSDCDAEGDLRSSLHRGDYAEKCPKNRSDMEIRGKQRSETRAHIENMICLAKHVEGTFLARNYESYHGVQSRVNLQ